MTLEIPGLEAKRQVSLSPEGSRRVSYRKGSVTWTKVGMSQAWRREKSSLGSKSAVG